MTHKTRPQPNIQVSVLPADASSAVQRMIQISQTLLDMSERETQALIQNDILAFAVLQDEKESMADQYTKASEEFRKRLHQFRSVDKALVKKLEASQNRLAEKAQENNLFVERIRERAERNTQKTLLAVQEMAQNKSIHFPSTQGADLKPGAIQQGA